MRKYLGFERLFTLPLAGSKSRNFSLKNFREVAQFGLAHLHGVQGVVGSNPTLPMFNGFFIKRIKERLSKLFFLKGTVFFYCINKSIGNKVLSKVL